MVLDKDTALKTAELLLQINAIKLKPENPFTWASGWKSPIYCDNRILLSYPAIRNYVREQMARQVETLYGKPDIIAGVATGAIGIGVLVAEQLGLPFVYVRPKPKEHGQQNRIEGHTVKGQSAVVIEDLISTGQSSLSAVDALKEAGVQVKGMLAVFSYGFDQAHQRFEERELPLNTLSNYEYLISQASKTGHITEAQLQALESWRANPQEWKP